MLLAIVFSELTHVIDSRTIYIYMEREEKRRIFFVCFLETTPVVKPFSLSSRLAVIATDAQRQGKKTNRNEKVKTQTSVD